MDLSKEQMVQVAACIAAGYAVSHEYDAVDEFYRVLEELDEREKAKAANEQGMKIN